MKHIGSDALWAGTPVLTLAGETFAWRLGARLLQEVYLPELVAYSEAEFVDKATALCANPEERQRLRQHLARARTTSSLFDTQSYVRDLEDAYLCITERERTS